MNRKKPATSVAAQVDCRADQPHGHGDDNESLASAVAIRNDSRNKPVFRSDSGLIFGNTSLIDDALLREAIAGRFCL